jgi:hypothetical protein
MTLERCVEQTRISPEIRGLRGTVNLDQTNPEILNDNGIDLGVLRPVSLTGGLLDCDSIQFERQSVSENAAQIRASSEFLSSLQRRLAHTLQRREDGVAALL